MHDFNTVKNMLKIFYASTIFTYANQDTKNKENIQ